ncbi:NAD(P)/FAD-dependent oxidoreductase [Nocardia colli]|uniref:NAD(P)/FAD-dependent oxidoreductase n=1 Tax=Nocardia colli TaxID=2545717 RepID=A0A5N0E5X9_9NOCA|nr:NAD(P)/FAD-dependent oxidoreductase [Nocardia colli]KAA8883041.1 NAD(P)/FAD-dependent oxidoreductase [Nocardia colli]
MTSGVHGSSWDAIVIGAGLGGLSAASYLAASGLKVTLLEQYSVLGGSSHVFRRKRKWEFDVGVHYIGDCGPNGNVPTLLRGIGLDDRVQWLPLDTDGFDTIIAPDFELRIPVGWDNYLENLIQAFPGEERGLRRYVSIVRAIGESLDRTATSANDLRRAVMRAGTAAAWAPVPHAALLAACRLKPRTMLALSVQDGAAATPPHRAPVAVAAAFLENFVGRGAWFPRGGGQVLAAGFAEVIRGHGGQIRTRTEVDRILVESGRVTGVRLRDGEILTAPVVVSAADIKRTYRDLIGYEQLPRWAVMRNEHYKMALPLINGYFGIEIDLAGTPNTNYYTIPATTWKAADSLWSLSRMSSQLLTGAGRRDPRQWAEDFALRQPTYVQSSTRRDPANHFSAPPGHAAIEAQTLAPWNPALWGVSADEVATQSYRSNSAYRDIKEIIAGGLLARVDQAFPGAAAKVQWSELATPATQERYTRTTNGTSYGLEPRITQLGPLRPGARTPIRGLFLAGTSTSTGPATEGAMLSGVQAASAIVGRDLLAEVRAGAVLADPTRIAPWGADFDPLAACRGGRAATDDDAAPLIRI